MSYYAIIKSDTANNYYLFSEPEISDLKVSISPKNLAAFKNDMEDLLSAPPESVTEKEKPVEGANAHDYVSLATYYWPDEHNPSAPYIRRDGFVNPEGALYDKDKLKRLAYLIYHLSLLYLLTDEDRYLQQVKKHSHNWFVNPQKRMNPHLGYGQFIPGTVKGRAEGIIDYAASFIYALNLLCLLARRGALGEDLQRGLTQWHGDFHQWLINSDIGKTEYEATNNHGTFYDLTLTVIEQFLETNNEIPHREASLKKRITEQIAPDFSLPKETARARSINYSFMGLKGLLELALMLERFGVESRTVFYPRLKKPLDWIINNAVKNRKDWPFTQCTSFDPGALLIFQKLAAAIYGPEYNDIQNYVDSKAIENPVLYYLFFKEKL